MATHGLFFDAEIITAEKIERPFPAHDGASLERELRCFYGETAHIKVSYRGQFQVGVHTDMCHGMYFLATIGNDTFYYISNEPGFKYLSLVFNNQAMQEQQSIL
ncbi:hypothetical protein [Pseudomonas sp. BJa3]|uniref:hypothetical protein n=1 Tax=Pseudomonas sp. BJa3 TaxID=2986525 RepID=UPI002265DAB9|nr:hypothetical protein [Pseudomonas sp. BJa3]MCX5509681.1 hypothetical protein [Pseudomonas sp. BJa3]